MSHISQTIPHGPFIFCILVLQFHIKDPLCFLGFTITLPVSKKFFLLLIFVEMSSKILYNLPDLGFSPESGKKVARFSLATNEYYKNKKGEKVQNTEQHTIVTWVKTAEIIEKYVGKGKEIGVSGKLKSGSYEDKDGVKRYVTEVEANEILLLGAKSGNNSAD